MEEKNTKFEYSYSAPSEEERREIASIRRQYEDRSTTTEGKLQRLRRLDALVNSTATAFSLAVGVIGLLIFGLGMAMVLEWSLTLWGVLVCVVGALPIGMAYPLYCKLLARGKKKYGAEILQLSEELLGKTE